MRPGLVLFCHVQSESFASSGPAVRPQFCVSRQHSFAATTSETRISGGLKVSLSLGQSQINIGNRSRDLQANHVRRWSPNKELKI